jgi:hypothetical protein
MSDLLGISKITLPKACLTSAHAHLRHVGQYSAEAFALWAGLRDGAVFQITQSIIPEQRALLMDSGICVTVGSKELHRINIWLYERQLTLIAQLHTHPDRAYHSETDDMYPIATADGSLSLVVPNFAREPFALENCAIYRLYSQRWLQLSIDDVIRLIQIVD